jgi:hypothetical protein
MMSKEEHSKSNAALDNHANQLNPNNDAYWESRGQSRPEAPQSPPSEQKTEGKSK